MMYKNKATTGMEKLDDAVKADRIKRKAVQGAGQVMTIEVSPEQYEIFRACTDTGQDMILQVRRKGLIPAKDLPVYNTPAKPYNPPAKAFLGKVILMIQ